MAGINYLYRRGGRYYFRRRLYLRTIINCPIMIAMGTADPVQARRLVARLSVIWDETIMAAREQVTRGHLNATEAVAVFKGALNEELGLAAAGRHDVSNDNDRTNRVLAATYRVAALLDPEAISVSDGLLDIYTRDFSEADRRAVVLMLKGAGPHRSAPSEAEQALSLINAPVNRATIREAAIQILLAKAEAQSRAGLLAHPLANAVGEPLLRLIDDDAVAAMRNTHHSVTHTPVSLSEKTNDTPYLTMETQRFSEIIESTISAIQRSGDWNQDTGQRRTAMRAFAWVTGDKRLCDYRPADAEKFAETLAHLPTSFRWGTPENGAMSRDFAEVLRETRKAQGKEKRSPRTLNRDLSTMARVASQLAKVAWKPKYGDAQIIKFHDFTAAVVENINDPDRMPWTEENLRAAFKSPLYTGGGGLNKRFKTTTSNRTVWQDAAYWVPLLLTYTFVAREEACGLECADFVFDVKTPYIIIRANMTRSKDGETPGGLKRNARFRMIPIHPDLLRLGLQAYVEHIAAEGHVMAFPELYQAEHSKKGGTRFYACAGRYLLAYVDEVEPLLRTSKNKRADLHSMRTSGGSALEDSDAKQLQVDDIMGHAREGMGPRKYSKAWYQKGGDVILAKRLALMVDVIPDITSHLTSAPLRLLPLHERSRTGSASGCVSRKNA
jgi:integrase